MLVVNTRHCDFMNAKNKRYKLVLHCTSFLICAHFDMLMFSIARTANFGRILSRKMMLGCKCVERLNLEHGIPIIFSLIG